MNDFTIEEQKSPDGLLTFVIEGETADIRLGFAESQWHIHAERLVGRWGATEEEAARAYARAVLESRLIISILRQGDAILYVMVLDDQDPDPNDVQEGQILTFRYWDGRPAPI